MKNILFSLSFILMLVETRAYAREIPDVDTGVPFRYEAALADGIYYKINILKAERSEVSRERSNLFKSLDRQTRELELLRQIAEGRGLTLNHYIDVPESMAGVVLYFGTLAAGSVMKRRIPSAFAGSLSFGEIAFTATALGGAAWSLYEIVDHQRMLNHLKSMKLEEIEKIHSQKAAQYNRDFANYNQMNEVFNQLSAEIKVLELQAN